MNLKISDQKSVSVSKDMYGLFFEDINYSLDGGLYAEMLENRNFESVFAYGKKDDFHTVFDGGYGWSLYENHGNGSSIHFDSRDPVNPANPHYMIFDGKGANSSFTNKAYDGIYAKKGKKYQVTFYAKVMEGHGDIEINIQKNGKKVAAGYVSLCEGEWKKYAITLTPEETIEEGAFVVSLKEEGTVAFDFFSMIPEDAVLGIFRKDLSEKLKALEPSFLRFPGGCIVEGNTLDNRYRWKDTIAPAEERKFNWNRWAVHNNSDETGFSGPYPHYGQTYGVGYYEYFLLCEYLGAKALPVMNVGLACQFMSTEKVDVEGLEMQQYIQDALDLIEFANGDVTTEWGKKRADMGHPDSFQLEYLGVGNEQWQSDTVNFFGRYEMFEKAIHEKYPEIKLIGSAGPDVWSDGYKKAWAWASEAVKKNDNLVYAIDEHYYVSPEWLYDHVHFYDQYDRQIKVFAGEYACHIPGRAGRMNCPEANTLGAALAEAAFMTGLEKNADVVVLASYAPLLARMGYTQWSPDLIWFNGDTSYVTPSYYVQQLYSKYSGVKTLTADFGLDQETERKEGIYASAVEDEKGKLILKIVNSNEEEREMTIEDETGQIMGDIPYTTIVMSGEKEDRNTIQDREKVSLHREEKVLKENRIKVPGNSFSVILFDGKK
ncbi:MAG: alpha-L-arabinofuranosidase C-terminal domain-containing protein [Lachnospiraceae bacterium]|nr:alpha-L-arabinofuranosidase C-terminal domain-containing protein [Lachnospiraceae bacterium]